MDIERHLDEKTKSKQKKKDITHRKLRKNDSEGSAQDYTKFILSSVGNSAISNLAGSGFLQAKLNVSRPGDFYEKQADNAAEQVMKSSSDTTPPKITPLQSKNRSGLKVSKETEKGVKNLKGNGKPINRDVRDYFQPRFGTNLGNVRIHTGNNANKLAESVNARAFTHGNDVVFAKGEFQPGSKEGKKLIAHELAHVQQQSSGSNIVSRKPEEGSKAVEGPQLNEPEQTQEETKPAAVNPPKTESYSLVAIAGEGAARFLSFLTRKLVDGSIGSLMVKVNELEESESEDAAALVATYKERIQELTAIRSQVQGPPITLEDVDNAISAAYEKVQLEKNVEQNIEKIKTALKESDQMTPEEEQQKIIDDKLELGLATLKQAWEELKPQVTDKILTPAGDYGKKVFWEYLGPGAKTGLISAGVGLIAALELLSANLSSDYEEKLQSGYFEEERGVVEGIIAKMPSLVGSARNGLEDLAEIDISLGDHVKITPLLGGYDEHSTGLGARLTVGNEKVSGSVEGGTTYNYSQAGKGARSWGPFCKAELKIKDFKLFEDTKLNIGASGEYSEQIVLDPLTKEEEIKRTIEQHMLNGGFSIGTITPLGGGGDNSPALSTNLALNLSRDLTQAISAHSLKASLSLNLQNERKFSISYEGQFGDKTKNTFSVSGQIKNLRIEGIYDADSNTFIGGASLIIRLP